MRRKEQRRLTTRDLLLTLDISLPKLQPLQSQPTLWFPTFFFLYYNLLAVMFVPDLKLNGLYILLIIRNDPPLTDLSTSIRIPMLVAPNITSRQKVLAGSPTMGIPEGSSTPSSLLGLSESLMSRVDWNFSWTRLREHMTAS